VPLLQKVMFLTFKGLFTLARFRTKIVRLVMKFFL
jgi:hypothetical protein